MRRFLTLLLLANLTIMAHAQPDATDHEYTTAGKKLLLFGGPGPGELKARQAEIEQTGINGFMYFGDLVFHNWVADDRYENFIAEMADFESDVITDNFLGVYIASGEFIGDFDWFDAAMNRDPEGRFPQMSWDDIIHHWVIVADAAKKSGCAGIAFDTENYAAPNIFTYAHMTYIKEKGEEAYNKEAFRRGADIMRACREVFPDIKILYLFGGKPGTLMGAFVDGMLSECHGEAQVIDGREQTYGTRIPQGFQYSRRVVHEEWQPLSTVPEAWSESMRIGFGNWPDWGNNPNEDLPFNRENFQLNYFTPDELAWTLNQAFKHSDEYVWLWRGSVRWEAGTVQNAEGEWVPIPDEYRQAMVRAHEENVPTPALRPRASGEELDYLLRLCRSHKKVAEEWSWEEEPEFNAYWSDHEDLGALPTNWRFRRDIGNVGVDEGWWRPDFDDNSWENIRTERYWEAEGFVPYDGYAWYRRHANIPQIPDGRRLYLACPGVDSNAWIWVNGKPVTIEYMVEPGEDDENRPEGGKITLHNKHMSPFYADITDLAVAGDNEVAIRILDSGWVGGLNKGMKLFVSPEQPSE